MSFLSSPGSNGGPVVLTAFERELIRAWPFGSALNNLMAFERWYRNVVRADDAPHPVDAWIRLNIATNGGKCQRP